MSVKIVCTNSDAMYEPGGPLEGSGQTDRLDIGPFEFVRMIYEGRRVGPDGDLTGLLIGPDGDFIGKVDGTWHIEHDGRTMLFSDVTVCDANVDENVAFET